MATFPTGFPNRTGAPLGLMTVVNHVGGLVRTQRNAGGTSLDVDFDPVAAGYATTGYLSVGPAAGPWNIIKYTGRNSATGGGTFTGCTGGQNGSTDAISSVGHLVAQAPIAATINDLADELIAGLTKVGTGSSTPATANHVLKSNGSGASAWGFIGHASLDVPVVAVKADAVQTISSGVVTDLVMGAEDSDTVGWHSTTVNPERVTIGTAGTYLITALVFLQFPTPAASCQFGGYIMRNGTDYLAFQSGVPAATDTIMGYTVAHIAPLAVNDYITAALYHNYGSSLSTVYTATVSCRLNIVRVA